MILSRRTYLQSIIVLQMAVSNRPKLSLNLMIDKVTNVSKGDLITKCPFSVIIWTKIPTKKFDNFYPRILKSEISAK